MGEGPDYPNHVLFAKNHILCFIKSRNIVRLAGFGMKKAPKNALTGAFGWPIGCRMGWTMPKRRKGRFFVPVFRVGCMRWGLDAGIKRKVRCGVFGISRTV